MARIVTTTYRYKRPQRKKQAVPIAVPAVVAAKSGRRRQVWEAAAEREEKPRLESEAARSISRPATNGDRKPVWGKGRAG